MFDYLECFAAVMYLLAINVSLKQELRKVIKKVCLQFLRRIPNWKRELKHYNDESQKSAPCISPEPSPHGECSLTQSVWLYAREIVRKKTHQGRIIIFWDGVARIVIKDLQRYVLVSSVLSNCWQCSWNRVFCIKEGHYSHLRIVYRERNFVI